MGAIVYRSRFFFEQIEKKNRNVYRNPALIALKRTNEVYPKEPEI